MMPIIGVKWLGLNACKWLGPRVRSRQAQQLAAMFSKWLQKNPERWPEPVAKLFSFAIFSAGRKPKTLKN